MKKEYCNDYYTILNTPAIYDVENIKVKTYDGDGFIDYGTYLSTNRLNCAMECLRSYVTKASITYQKEIFDCMLQNGCKKMNQCTYQFMYPFEVEDGPCMFLIIHFTIHPYFCILILPKGVSLHTIYELPERERPGVPYSGTDRISNKLQVKVPWRFPFYTETIPADFNVDPYDCAKSVMHFKRQNPLEGLELDPSFLPEIQMQLFEDSLKLFNDIFDKSYQAYKLVKMQRKTKCVDEELNAVYTAMNNLELSILEKDIDKDQVKEIWMKLIQDIRSNYGKAVLSNNDETDQSLENKDTSNESKKHDDLLDALLPLIRIVKDSIVKEGDCPPELLEKPDADTVEGGRSLYRLFDLSDLFQQHEDE